MTSTLTPSTPTPAPTSVGVTLAKRTDCYALVLEPEGLLSARRRRSRVLVPWYPIAGHRQGLRRNDLNTLWSSLVISTYH